MPMPARTFGEPIADQLGLVARGVVHDNVDVEISRHILFDLVEELAELARAMARHAFCDDLADLEVEPCDVTHLLDKHRVGGELEGLDPVRLQAEGSPDAMHARDRNT